MGIGTDRAVWIRSQLRAGRLARGLSQQRVADLISEDLGRPRAYTKQMVSLWESFKSQPGIDVLAAWARVLGLRLDVDLVGQEDGRIPARLLPDSVPVALQFEALSDANKRLVTALISSLLDPQ